MKISLDWISDYVNLPAPLDARRIAHDLTMSTVEVEAAVDLSADLAHIVIGRIAELSDIPSKRLRHVICDLGEHGSRSIVCGGSNLRQGMLVVVAMPGAHIRWHGKGEPQAVQSVVMAGLASEAIICAANELSVETLFPADERVIIDATELGAAPGTPFADVIGWNDIVLEIDNKSLTHRPDLWGHYGIARELAAIYGVPLKPLPKFDRDLPPADLVSHLDDACNRFAAVRFENLTNDPAPLRMRSRLARVGQRPISLLVDLTNYVTFVTGQPCHLFDSGRVTLPLSVRMGSQGQSLVTLDDVDRDLGSVLAVCDARGPVSVAGIMGGAETGVDVGTRAAVLEVANFDAGVVRRGATRLNLRTEASTRFEKAVDTQRVDDCLAVFVETLRATVPEAKITGFSDLNERPTRRNHVEAELDFIRRRLGKNLAADEIRGILTRIGCDVTMKGETFAIVVPTWRSTGDVDIPDDIVEEIARLHGYEHFEFVPPSVSLTGPVLNRQVGLSRALREYFAFSGGMQEVVTYPWVDDKLLDAAGLADTMKVGLSAPPSPELGHLRPSLVPGMLRSIAANLRFFESFRIFELGTAFTPSSDAPDGVHETRFATGALVGQDRETLLREAKGLVEGLARNLHIEPLTLVPAKAPPWGIPGSALDVHAHGSAAGTIAVVNRRAKLLAEIKRSDAVLFEFDVGALCVLPSRDNRFVRLPEYPEVTADLSVIVDADVAWSDIADALNGLHPLLIQVDFVDRFKGEGVPPGKKSVTLRLTLASPERTLAAEDSKAVLALAIETLGSKLNASLRS